ncbi:Endo-1,4-beta-xylanase 2 [Fulvia fulva]|nr:Endo-1,4-beta-xylanase 2 [Fulvia fulva]WPV19244.1 Endo-1,4-beta-xylanase 2 [Fulvia fulva]WPV33984.1 Endo-1,4-beta-xylanase 2 [Fulvia fulva]
MLASKDRGLVFQGTPSNHNIIDAVHFSTLLSSSLLATATTVVANPTRGSKSDGLANAMRAKGSNKNDFNSITPENAQKWEVTEPSRGNSSFADADRYVDYATSHGIQIHCHYLVWHSQLPTWVSEGGFDHATLIQVMKEHIQALAGRYKCRCTRWEVVNEALNEDGTTV